MIGEDLALVRNQKPGAENIEVYLRTAAGNAHERIAMLVCRRFACACHALVAQFQSGRALAEANYHMNEAHAGLVSLNDRLGDLASSLKPLQALFHHA